MKRSISIFPGDSLPPHNPKVPFYDDIDITEPKDSEPWELRYYQEDIVNTIFSNQQSMIISPTGSGKSLSMIAVAAKNYRSGISTFILVPKVVIADVFDHTDDRQFSVKIGNIEYNLPECEINKVDGNGTSKRRKDAVIYQLKLSQRISTVTVCCYQSFNMAYRSLRKQLDPSKIHILIDEAHHTKNDERDQNTLGKLVRTLSKDGVQNDPFTATGYRADGGDIVSNGCAQYRRTLVEQYQDGYCPDLNVNFRFFDDIDYEDHNDTTGQDVIDIESPDKLIDAYVKEYNTKRHTLMILPSIIKKNGRKISAAKVASDLEKALVKQHKDIKIINFGGYDDQLVSMNNAKYSELREKFTELKSSKEINVVISIKIMDEGVDWPDCDTVFIARVPQSLPLIVQRIGRATRKKDRTADIYFFELGVRGDDKRITTAMVHTACRLQCLFHGLEFKESFTFDTGRLKTKSVLQKKLLTIPPKKLNDINYRLHRFAIDLDGTKNSAKIIEFIIDEYKDHIELSRDEAYKIAITQNVIKIPPKALKAIESFIRRLSTKSKSFCEFCDDEKIKPILDNLIVQGPREYLKLLSGNKAKELVGHIHEWRSNSANKNKDKLLELAKSEISRPHWKTSLGVALCNYTNSSNGSYDEDFDKEIRRLRPDWFENTANKNKDKLLKLAKSRALRPNSITSLGRVLCNYTNSSNGSYDADFSKKIRKLAPKWFENKTDTKKEELLKLAKSGALRPNSKTSLGSALICYTNPPRNSYDAVFDKEIRILAPKWFENTANKNKEKLLKLTKSGASRPKKSKTPLGNALYRYTNSSNGSFDAVFDKEIRKLRPD